MEFEINYLCLNCVVLRLNNCFLLNLVILFLISTIVIIVPINLYYPSIQTL